MNVEQIQDLQTIALAVEARERLLVAYEEVIQNVSDPIIMINSEGFVMVWNRAAESLFGFSANETVGSPVMFFVMGSEFWEPHMKGMKQIAERKAFSDGGDSKKVHRIARNSQGEEFPIQIRLQLFVNGDNKARVIAVITEEEPDATEG
jgi:PAS domain S-box-containing protein